VRIVESRLADHLDTLHSLFGSQRHRLGLPALPKRFFEALTSSPALNPVLFLAVAGERPAGALLVLASGKLAILEYSAEAEDFRGQGVSSCLYWAAIEAAVREGRSAVSFGRSDVSDSGLRLYKSHWGTVESNLYTYERSTRFPSGRARENGAASGRKLVSALLARSPEWCYRVLSQFCYRHWA
jgi:GNAT superfamily N-acetyltransferase